MEITKTEQQRLWKLYGVDFAAAATSSAMVSPFIAVVDRSVYFPVFPIYLTFFLWERENVFFFCVTNIMYLFLIKGLLSRMLMAKPL